MEEEERKRAGEEGERQKTEGNSIEEREKYTERRKLGVLHVSSAIFQTVFLQDNGFN